MRSGVFTPSKAFRRYPLYPDSYVLRIYIILITSK